MKLILAIVLLFAARATPADVVIHTYKTNVNGAPKWFVWADHDPSQHWSINVATKLRPPDWFTYPGYVDQTGRVYALIPNNQNGLFFEAQKRSRANLRKKLLTVLGRIWHRSRDEAPTGQPGRSCCSD